MPLDAEPEPAAGHAPVLLLSTAVAEALAQAAQETDWPDDAVLYEPCENEQSLLYEYAECLSARTVLRMADLHARVEHRPNAEFMSPTGNVPLLKLGKTLVSDTAAIVELVSRRSAGGSLSASLTDEQRADMRALLATVRHALLGAQMWLCWAHDETLAAVTRRRYGSVYPFPLNHVLPWLKRRHMLRRLDALGWADATLEDVLSEIDRCCEALSSALGDKPYFFGDSPCELDATVFGHVYTLVTTELPDVDAAGLVRRRANLVDFVKRVETTYFRRSDHGADRRSADRQ